MPSSNDSEGDADSDELSKEREEELYSVLHYNDFSQGVPPELLEKYCISTDKNNEFVISFKKYTEQSKPVSDRDDGSKAEIERREGTPLKDTDSYSDEDVVLVGEQSRNPQIETFPNPNRDSSGDLSVTSSSNLKNIVDVQPRKCLKSVKSNSKNIDDGEEEKFTQNPMKRKSTDVEPTLAPTSNHTKSIEGKMFPNSSKATTSSNMAQNPKKRKLNQDKVRLKSDTISEDSDDAADDTKSKCSLPLKVPLESVVEEHSESDDSSCVVVEDPEFNRKISVSSSESVVELQMTEQELQVVISSSSEEEETSGFTLNTTEVISYDSDGNVSDVIETSQYEWKEVASPSTWTKEMKKYYNSSCERLRYFDHKKIRQQIKTGTHEHSLDIHERFDS